MALNENLSLDEVVDRMHILGVSWVVIDGKRMTGESIKAAFKQCLENARSNVAALEEVSGQNYAEMLADQEQELKITLLREI